MTFTETFLAIVAGFLAPEAASSLAAIVAVPIIAYLWGRKRRTSRQSRIVHLCTLLWLALPMSALIAAAFRFSGPPDARGVIYNDFGAVLAASVLPAVVLASLVLFAFGKGVRTNVAGITGPLIFSQCLVSLLAGCTIVGMCL